MSAFHPRDAKVLQFLRTYVERHGCGPSYAEIGAGVGIASKHGVFNIIDRLVRAGSIARTGRQKWRSIELLQTEDHHSADCDCDGCAKARYIAALQIVQALQVTPPIALTGKFVGLLPLTHLTRLDWRYRDKSRVRRKPLLSSAKAAKQPNNAPILGGAKC